MKRSQISLLVVGMLIAASAVAQQSPGLVKVDLATIADTLAQNINVDVEKIPASLEMPVGMATSTCDIPAAKLAADAVGGMASCQATTSSTELEQMLSHQLKAAPTQ
jgi:hypothetical protein